MKRDAIDFNTSRAMHMISRYVITNMISHSHDVMLRHNKNNAIFKSKLRAKLRAFYFI